ncbi:unnamed protein product [Ilex paraguariensis]|uniref:Retrotransposon Copia-like N-terminal domain-containing protein n=1 Tax=Ilex paraguariensis TaxID=185542 RepID=A0ABC8QU28_9AQUA
MEPKQDVIAPSLPPTSISPIILNGLMTSVKLNKTNYTLWSRSVQVFLRGNFTRAFEVCKEYFQLEQGTLSLEDYYSHVRRGLIMVSPLIAQFLWFLLATVMVIEVDMMVVVVVVVKEVVQAIVGAVVDPVAVLIVAVEDTLLIYVGIYMENLLVLRITLPIRMIPLLLLPYLGQLHQTLESQNEEEDWYGHEAGGLYYFDFDSPTRAPTDLVVSFSMALSSWTSLSLESETPSSQF